MIDCPIGYTCSMYLQNPPGDWTEFLHALIAITAIVTVGLIFNAYLFYLGENNRK